MALYTATSYDHLIGTPGFSDQLLKTHFELYKGYVKNASALDEKLTALRGAGTTASPEYAELKRRFGWEWNGMRLHEIYFENMTPKRGDARSAQGLNRTLTEGFGSFDAWAKDFKATGAMRGIGWAAAVWDTNARRVVNVWVDEHDTGHLAGCPILLLMDVFEHAFLVDYGTKRADYIEAFFGAIAWGVVEERLQTAMAGVHTLAGASARA